MVDTANKNERKSKGTYYDAATSIRDVPGVVKKLGEYGRDFYSGSAEALAAAGLLAPDLFHGQPGRNVASAAYRPIGGVREAGECWHDVPGYAHVNRGGSGRCQLWLTVSREVRDQRAAAKAWEQRTRDAERRRREKVDEERGVRMERERLQRIAAMSRPEPAPASRAHLRLVWSA